MKKRSISLLLSVLLIVNLLTAIPISANAAVLDDSQAVAASSGTTGDCTWTLDDNGVLTISGNGAMENYSHTNVSGSYVTSAPWGSGITSVLIENGVTYIGEYAFYNCAGLANITIPDSVASIGRYAFSYTSWYNDQPNGLVYAGKVAYKYKGTMPANTAVVIQDGTKGITYEAFSGCTGLASVIIPDSVTSIGDRAFSFCSGLTSVTISNNVTTIGDYTFYGCTGLTSISIPDGVTSIGWAVFYGCTGLTSVAIPGSVTSIGSVAFDGCTSLTSVTIPGSVTSIGADAFGYYHDNNHNLTKVPGFTICGYANTAAQTYANTRGFAFVEIEEPPTEEPPTEEAPTEEPPTEEPPTEEPPTEEAPTEEPPTEEPPTEEPPTVEPPTVEPPTVEPPTDEPSTEEAPTEEPPTEEPPTEEPPTVHSHTFGEWIIDKEPTVLNEGKKHRVCQSCNTTEEAVIEKVSVDVENSTDYGLAVFTVVNAQTKQPISGAGVFVSTETEGEATFFTDAQGHTQTVLPVGKQTVSVYAGGCLTRNLTIKIVPGVNNIPQIGLSSQKTYTAEVTHHLMDAEEIAAAGIDMSSVGNHNVFKYELKLAFRPEIDWYSIFYYKSDTGELLGGGGTTGSDPSESKKVTWIPPKTNTDGGHFYIPPTDTEPGTDIYPISEHFYMIVRGNVRWLKEIFDVEMLVVNNAMTDTLENLNATLEIPEGLSLARMKETQQTLAQELGTIEEGGSKSAHWYVRGDAPGDYNITARLQGMIMPFEEPIDDCFEVQNPLHVWSGNALHLNFEFPDAAYYGKDYPITITLENVSDITLYDVSHVVQIEQGMEIYHFDGNDKTRIEYSVWGIGVWELHPGDKIIIETSVNTFFDSEAIKQDLQQWIGIVDDVEALMKAVDLVTTTCEVLELALGGIVSCSNALYDYVTSDEAPLDKVNLCKELQETISDFVDAYLENKDKTVDAAVKLSDSGMIETCNAITDDPNAWVQTHSTEEIEQLIKDVDGLKNSTANNADSSGKFNVFDSVRTAISAIPVRYMLKSVTLTEDQYSSATIPWSYTISETGPQYFGVSNVSKYVSSIVTAFLGEAYEEEMPCLLQLIPGLDDPFGKEDAIRDIKTTENEIAQFKAKGATGNVTFRAWVEPASPAVIYGRRALSQTNEDFLLSSDNATAQYENGVLTFTGNGTISVTPKSGCDGTLYIQDSDGNLYTYVMDVVPEHTCHASKEEIMIPPTEKYDGIAVKTCDICGDVIDIISLSKENICSVHTFGEWETEAEPSTDSCGLRVRRCTVCGHTEYETIDALEKHLVRLIVSHMPDKTSFMSGEELDLSGLQVTAEYDDQSTEVITDYTVHADLSSAGFNIPVTISYGGKSVSYTVNVKPLVLESINISKLPAKKQYISGEAFDTAGMEVTACYNDGTERVVDDYEVSSLSGNAGCQQLVITYQGKTAELSVMVYARGDVNRDGAVTIVDVTMIQKYLVELWTLNSIEAQLADVNGDGEVNISDATLVQRALAE